MGPAQRFGARSLGAIEGQVSQCSGDFEDLTPGRTNSRPNKLRDRNFVELRDRGQGTSRSGSGLPLARGVRSLDIRAFRRPDPKTRRRANLAVGVYRLRDGVKSLSFPIWRQVFRCSRDLRLGSCLVCAMGSGLLMFAHLGDLAPRRTAERTSRLARLGSGLPSRDRGLRSARDCVRPLDVRTSRRPDPTPNTPNELRDGVANFAMGSGLSMFADSEDLTPSPTTAKRRPWPQRPNCRPIRTATLRPDPIARPYRPGRSRKTVRSRSRPPGRR